MLWVAVFSTLDPARDALAGAAIAYGVLALVLLAATRGRLGYRREPYADEPAKDA